jgi:hypothetical protein
MAVARSKAEVVRFVLEADRKLPPEKQSVFLLRRMSTDQHMMLKNLQEMNAAGDARTVKVGTIYTTVLRIGLVGWENFATAEGTPAKFEVDAGEHFVNGIGVANPAKQETVNQLSPKDAEELVAAIWESNTFTVDDAKN